MPFYKNSDSLTLSEYNIGVKTLKQLFTFIIAFHSTDDGGILAAQSCPTLCDTTDRSLPDSFVHGISQARKLE